MTGADWMPADIVVPDAGKPVLTWDGRKHWVRVWRRMRFENPRTNQTPRRRVLSWRYLTDRERLDLMLDQLAGLA